MPADGGNSQVSNIAWDGESLRDYTQLGSDLSFRRMMTNAFSPGKPYSRRAVRHLVEVKRSPGPAQGPTMPPPFRELLEQAIAAANQDWEAQYRISSLAETAPANLDQDRKRDWAFRLLVFEELSRSDDFRQFVLENKPWYVKLGEWAELVRPTAKPSKEGEDSPAEESAGRMWPAHGWGERSIWSGLSQSFLQSLALVVPIAVGAGAVGSYVIDRQAQVNIENKIPEVNLSPLEEAIGETKGKVEAALGQITAVGNQVHGLRCDHAKLKATTDSHSELLKNIDKQVSSIPREVKDQRLVMDSSFSEGLKNVLTGVAPEGRFTVLLGNASPPPPSPGSGEHASGHNASDETAPKANAFGLRMHVDEMVLKQETYPIEMVSPKERQQTALSGLMEFNQTLTRVALSERNLGAAKAWDQSSLFLCDWRLPVRFLLTKSDTEQRIDACPSADLLTTAQKLVTLTKTAQYVPELDAYLSLDEASGRHFGLFGGRRIVVQIVPVQEEARPKPAEAPAKTQD